MAKKSVLFICTHNSCRSQIAEGIVNHYCTRDFEAFSAGIEKTHVHPLAVKAMNEIDIDISDQRSKTIDEFKGKTFDYVVTVCDHAKETCPFFPGKHVIHKGFEDPGDVEGPIDEKLHAFRDTRDEIKEWIKEIFCSKEKDEYGGGK